MRKLSRIQHQRATECIQEIKEFTQTRYWQYDPEDARFTILGIIRSFESDVEYVEQLPKDSLPTEDR